MSAKKRLRKGPRSNAGNIYIFYVLLCGLLIAAFYYASCFCISTIMQLKIKNALEAASLAAANDLSCIVVNDPYWGYVSLTDHPPVGKETVAGDQESLPVTGINTIMGTVRQELILAHSIGTTEAMDCALLDLRKAREASTRLQEALTESITKDGAVQRDFNGEIREPLKTAKRIYRSNIEGIDKTCGFKLKNLEADLGWLDGGSTTNCKIFESACFNKELEQLAENGCYPAFVNVPFDEESFYFAGLGNQSSLVEESKFRYGNGEQVCSIIRLTAKLSKNVMDERGKPLELQFRACAQPFYLKDLTKPPIMALNVPHGLPSKIKTMRDILSSQSLGNRVPLYTSHGDYPVDPNSRLVKDEKMPSATVRQVFTRGFMDWVRACHLNADLDSIVANLDTKIENGFEKSPSNVYLYGFNENGHMVILKPRKIPFRKQVTYDKQLYTVAFNSINSDALSWTCKVRDQVRNLGTINGGKHAGQAMPSIDFVDELKGLSKPLINTEKENRFASKAGSRYDQSRLAVEIEISSPQQLSAGTGQTF